MMARSLLSKLKTPKIIQEADRAFEATWKLISIDKSANEACGQKLMRELKGQLHLSACIQDSLIARGLSLKQLKASEAYKGTATVIDEKVKIKRQLETYERPLVGGCNGHQKSYLDLVEENTSLISVMGTFRFFK